LNEEEEVRNEKGKEALRARGGQNSNRGGLPV
jgi:hypothetical protein